MSVHSHLSSLPLRIAELEVPSHIPDKPHMILAIHLPRRHCSHSSLLQQRLGSRRVLGAQLLCSTLELGLELPHGGPLSRRARQARTGEELVDAQIIVLDGVINTQERVIGVAFIGARGDGGGLGSGTGTGSKACELGGDLGGVEVCAGGRIAGVGLGFAAGLRGVGGGGCGGCGGVAGGDAGG